MRDVVISRSITDRDSKSLKAYFNELNGFNVLTPEDENELAILARHGDEKAKQKLIKHNLRFVVSVAKQYKRPGIKLEDLINEGNYGLIKAANNFDPTRGFKFISYAVWQIRRYIYTYAAEHSKTLKLPVDKIMKSNRIKKQYSLLEQKLERSPSYEEIIDQITKDYTHSDIEFYFANTDIMISSLDAPLNNDGESGSLLDVINDFNESKANYIVSKEDSDIRKNTLLKRLNNVEATIIKLAYGLDGGEPKSLIEISEIINMSVARVSRLKDVSLRKLKYQLIRDGRWLKEL